MKRPKRKIKTAKVKLLNTAYIDFMKTINQHSNKKGSTVELPYPHEEYGDYGHECIEDDYILDLNGNRIYPPKMKLAEEKT